MARVFRDRMSHMNKIGENYQEKFALAMDRLNTEQREAVETLE